MALNLYVSRHSDSQEICIRNRAAEYPKTIVAMMGHSRDYPELTESELLELAFLFASAPGLLAVCQEALEHPDLPPSLRERLQSAIAAAQVLPLENEEDWDDDEQGRRAVNHKKIIAAFHDCPDTAQEVLIRLTHVDQVFFYQNPHQRLPLARVLYKPWNSGRLRDCTQRLQAGGKAPRIEAAAFKLYGMIWYVVSDGNHRSAAAHQAGRTNIAANVQGWQLCYPQMYRLATTPHGIDLIEIVQIQHGIATCTRTRERNLQPKMVEMFRMVGVGDAIAPVGFPLAQ